MFKIRPQERQLLKKVSYFSSQNNTELFLVGGFLRDIILERVKENADFDFAARGKAISFGRKLSNYLKCAFVILDKEHGSCRLVKKEEKAVYTLDFTDFRGKSIEEDLYHRDFTINTLALELGKFLDRKSSFAEIMDFYRGKRDIKERVIKAVNENSFIEDPLRILRAFSFSAALGFSIEEKTLRLAKQSREKLISVSGERLRDELFKVFSTQESYRYLLSLDEIKVLDIIFPEIKKMRRIGQGPYHHLDVWQHTLESIRQLEGVFSELKNRQILDYLNEVISSERTRRSLLKFGALLHDVGKPATLRRKDGRTTFHGHERVGLKIAQDIARRIKLSNDEIFSLHKMVLWHLRPGYLADSKNPTARAKFRYFRDAGREALSILLLSLADQRSTKGPLTTSKARKAHERVVSNLISEYLEKSKQKKEERILNGHEIMKKFDLQPSPLVGKILKEIEELQAIGKVKNKEEAFKIAEKLIRSKR